MANVTTWTDSAGNSWTLTEPNSSCAANGNPCTLTATLVGKPPPVTQIPSGNYWFGTTQNSNIVGIDNNGSSLPQAYVPGNSTYTAEKFIWDGISSLKKYKCAQPYFADNNGVMNCTATQTDKFKILPVNGGSTIQDITTGRYLVLLQTCPTGWSNCVGFAASQTPTVWTTTTVATAGVMKNPSRSVRHIVHRKP